MRLFLFFILIFRSVYSYTDPELESLWASLSDVCNPSLEDYRLVESYLQHGKRPYLEFLYRKTPLSSWHMERRVKMVRNFKLVGPNGEMPVFELHRLNVTPETSDRCILIYASYNSPYPEKVYHILRELKECGYSGNVMIRIGGFPNLSEGGLKFCPFFFWKYEFIKEALRMGFTKIIHIDTSLRPVSDLSYIFETMETKGYFLLTSGCGTLPFIPPHPRIDYSKFSSVSPASITWLPGYVIGFNFANDRAAQLFYEWGDMMNDIEHFFCFGADEIYMTVLAYQYDFLPVDSWYDRTVYDFVPNARLVSEGSLLFWFDSTR